MSDVPVMQLGGESASFEVVKWPSLSRISTSTQTLTMTIKPNAAAYEQILKATEKEFALTVLLEANSSVYGMAIISMFVHCKNDGANNIATSDCFTVYKSDASNTNANLTDTTAKITVTRKVSADGTLTMTIKSPSTITNFTSAYLPTVYVVGLNA